MDDSCAVCADALEWVAYGPCGHREVCSTCVVRLRFVLDDRKCCICKVESPNVFVTKAMGDYTRVINDFSVFPPGANEGKVGDYWYHEDSQAYFDDVDQYKMIKAMCRLSCSVCDNASKEQTGETAKRRSRFRSVDQLKGHLFHQHKLLLCSLCLESRKVFICEQKLYTRAQLNRHISTGDSEVDGDMSERGGFAGHPMCQFCKSPFYGDNELYTHMSQDHFTCHICRRRDPGKYDYFKNYDDLENHFRHDHHLCEDESCLAEKFVVFQSESELKRHNAMKHGGNMSRAKRNAALTLPISFTYRSNAEEQRRGRGRGFRFSASNDDMYRAIQASLETGGNHAHSESGASSQVNAVAGSLESLAINSDSISQSSNVRNPPAIEEASFPALSGRLAPEPSGGYRQAVSSSRAALGQAAFPPLPGVSASTQDQRRTGSSYAAHIHKNRLQSKSAPRAAHASSGGSTQSGPSSSQNWPSVQQSAPSSSANLTRMNTATSHGITTTSNPVPSRGKSGLSNGTASSSAGSSWISNRANSSLSHSSSAPNLESMNNPGHNNAVVSERNKKQSAPDAGPSLPNVKDVHDANKSLIEKIRSARDMDDDKFSAFKGISAEYRRGSIGAAEYLTYVQEFGLSHLVVELAQLCPDKEKQKELVDIYMANMRFQTPDKDDKVSSSSRKMKGKSVANTERLSLKETKGMSVVNTENSGLKASLADDILNTMKKLQENYRSPQEEAEQLSKDGYRTSKGKAALPAVAQSTRSNLTANNSSSYGDDGDHAQNAGGAQAKQQKKTSKFHRVRLGDGSAAALLNLDQPDTSPERTTERPGDNQPGGGVRGVWKNGGGQKLKLKIHVDHVRGPKI